MTPWLLLLASLLIASSAWAGPQVLSWDEVPTATSYGVEQSVDKGATWTAVTPTVGPTCASGRCTVTVTAPATGFVLYRVWAANSVGRTTRTTAGQWVCESCAPPPAAANVGVQ